MALQRDTLYAGRFSTATTAHPQGAFKNRTTPTAQDGSYLEAQWLNDWDGFFGSLLSKAGLTPNGNIDAVGASQYFNALLTVASVAPVGTSRNLKCSVTTASATATFTADELVLGTALNGQKYHISSLSKSITLTTTGAGGMDTGAAPTSGYVAVYAIYNPTTGVSALLGVNATSTVAPEVYSGSNIPSGYTASALISVLPTNSSGQFTILTQNDRNIDYVPVTVLSTTSGATSLTPVSIASGVPINARRVNLYRGIQTSAITSINSRLSSDANGIGGSSKSNAAATLYQQYDLSLPITTSQTIYRQLTIGSGTVSDTIAVTGYSI